MEESGCPPDKVTYNVLLQGYLRNKHFDDVEMLLLDMDERGYFLDVSTMSLLIDSIAAGSVDTTMFKLIPRVQMNPSKLNYGSFFVSKFVVVLESAQLNRVEFEHNNSIEAQLICNPIKHH
ncbi:pentatricopeptide repeat protein [Artemisia annua]|uniref:Pentatricopeptide repeat protein n=1 Tax=Artemisia annua TaxID=35608 RepID=A0A2U1KXX0_ARTAN|nr:pentatricopeptide repeat protein [Artemisia annua]